MPPRRGQLFNPEAFPFLEGWSFGGAPVEARARAAVQPPSIDDETVYRVLEKLIVLEGQRLSYQSLDVEQIGSVYEALMGFHVKRLTGAGVCLRPSKVWVSVDEVLEQPANRRSAWLEDQGALEAKAAKVVGKALAQAKSEVEVLAALEPYRVKGIENRRPRQLVLQPGAERRRTSSHYTPRSLSAPIVRRALEPLLKAMGDQPSSERLLNLKICDPAMGSGAFLVEACRYLADQVVAAWTREGVLDTAPRDEDVVMRARPAGGAALPVRCRQESLGGEPGEAVAVARHPGEGRAVHLPRPRAQVRRLAGRARPRTDPGIPLGHREAAAVRPSARGVQEVARSGAGRSVRRSFSSHSIWSVLRSSVRSSSVWTRRSRRRSCSATRTRRCCL